MCSNEQDVANKLGREVAFDQARRRVLADIQVDCKPSNMISAHRMNVNRRNTDINLLDSFMSGYLLSIRRMQISPPDSHWLQLDRRSCLYPRLLSQEVYQNFEGSHRRSTRIWFNIIVQVWQVKFSPDGNHIASISKNCELCIWNFNNDTLAITLVSKENSRLILTETQKGKNPWQGNQLY